MKIHNDAAQGDKEAVLRELELGVPVDALDDEGRTPLMLAVSSPELNLEVVRLLLERGADPNARGGEFSRAVLIHALEPHNIELLECLLDAGSDISFSDESGYDVLNSAVRCDDSVVLDIVDFLIERGAPLRGESDYGESALSVSSYRGRFDVVKRLLDAGADETRLEWTPLMDAIALGTVEDVRTQLEQGASLLDRDGWERTPWLLSLAVGDVEKAKLLLEAGADRSDTGRCGKTALVYPIETGNSEMLRWLLDIGLDPDATDDYGETALIEAAGHDFVDGVRLLLNAGAEPQKKDHVSEKAISKTSSLEVVRLLLGAGQDLNELSSETRAVLLRVEDEGELCCSREEFEAGRNRRYGTTNPQKMDIPFWHAMIQSGVTAYTARAMFLSEDQIYEEGEQAQPVWCYKRFGKSLTELPDGRFIEIGGEHEDYYDPDFCIYNEVFVHHPDGQREIYGYHPEVFPPTDFHTATLVDGFIYIIGCMGYGEQRVVGYTPVYRLNVETLVIEHIKTTGENPGWVCRHKAALVGNEIRIYGGQVWTEDEENAANAAYDEAEEYDEIEEGEEDEQEGEGEFDSSDEESEEFSLDIQQMMEDMDRQREEEEERERTFRFALNLNSFEWRRLVE